MAEHEHPHRPGTPDPHGSLCCGEPECSTGLRNNYFVGKHLTPDAFRVEQKYLIERRQLLNRAVHGWGVVYGYPVTLEDEPMGRVLVGPGLALDRVGRELLHNGEHARALDDLIALDKKGVPYPPRKEGEAPPWNKEAYYLLSVHYAEQREGPVSIGDPCSCERREWDRVCETVRFSLRPIDRPECCVQPGCGLTCGCGAGLCCGEQADRKDHPGHPVRRGGCRCLCDYLTGFSPGFECKGLTEVKERCGSACVDLHNGVPLACVQVTVDRCGDWQFSGIEPCGPRQLVKRNDVLFDLIQGCDLTRIRKIGWEDWHRREDPVSFEDFSAAFGRESEKEPEYVSTLFWVEFSRPVRKETVLPDCFAMTALSVQNEGLWWTPLRVPIVRVETLAGPDDPAGHVHRATIVVEGGWVEDGLRGRGSEFRGDWDIRVEIEVRGDFIVDCNGQTIDANAVGLWRPPTGNGTPGDTFLSTFRVAPRENPSRRNRIDAGRRV